MEKHLSVDMGLFGYRNHGGNRGGGGHFLRVDLICEYVVMVAGLQNASPPERMPPERMPPERRGAV